MNHKYYLTKTNHFRKITQLALFIVLVLCLLDCTNQEKSHFLDFKGINKSEIFLLEKYLEAKRKENKFLLVIMDELKKAGYQIIIEFSDKTKIAGFKPEIGKMQFQFKNISDFKNDNVLIEEFFHAFQAHYYGIKKMQANQKGLIIGATNMEYEARLMKAIMAIYLDQSISETPSQKGLLEFTMSILDEKGKINSFKLDSIQHQGYIHLVAHFQQHWKNRNIKEGIKSVYDHPVDSTLGPDACFYLLRKLNYYEENNWVE